MSVTCRAQGRQVSLGVQVEQHARIVDIDTDRRIAGDDAARMQKLLDVLEDLDDAQDIFHNAAL